MSRPFSYNDDNFTVIGNILFVHVNIGADALAVGQAIITIPPAIFERMYTYNQQCIASNVYTSGAGVVVNVTCDNGKMISRTALSKSSILPRYLLTWYYLKDL